MARLGGAWLGKARAVISVMRRVRRIAVATVTTWRAQARSGKLRLGVASKGKGSAAHGMTLKSTQERPLL